MRFDVNNEKLILEEDGKEVEYNILFTFDSKDTNKSYIGYTDNKISINGRKTIYVSSYNPLNEKIELEDITDEKELNMIQEVLSRLDSEATGN